MHRALGDFDSFYKDLDSMLGIRPVRVTSLTPGTFDRYYTEKYAEGQELTQLQPPRMNPDVSSISDLLRLSS